MLPDPNVFRLRTLRIRSGLSQKELAEILGFSTAASVFRHETSSAVPNLHTALGYEAIFRVPISELFPGFYQTVQVGVEERLAKMEEDLHQSAAKGRNAAPVARKLEFCWHRRNVDKNDPRR
jgi:DNA-binding XRE family transcriptional regulator